MQPRPVEGQLVTGHDQPDSEGRSLTAAVRPGAWSGPGRSVTGTSVPCRTVMVSGRLGRRRRKRPRFNFNFKLARPAMVRVAVTVT